MTTKNVLLIEPGYPNKYPPLGLMKLAAYHGARGRGDNVTFIKGPDPQALLSTWDRVYVTTLFSFEWKRTAGAIDFAVTAARGHRERVFVGGIAASLMHDQFAAEPRWAGVRFIQGLLESPPATSLQLAHGPADFGTQDLQGTPIEHLVPDYSIIDQVDYHYPVHDAYFGYASRGCVRQCSFCGVPKLEGAQRDMPPLSNLVNGVASRHGAKKDLVLMDNNITAAPRYRQVIDEIVDLGFGQDATLQRDSGRPVRRRVDFNQGVDARILSKSPMFLRELRRTCISPLRIAFDHVGLRKPYETSVRMAADNSITSLSTYMLYNFMDSPEDLHQRMGLNIALNQELGIRTWSFPMRYQPINLRDRSHVGRHWSRYELRSFQIILQPTHGIISGSPDFFQYACGRDPAEFQDLLTLPHHFLFHREHYRTGPGSPQQEEYHAITRRMSPSQRRELIQALRDTLTPAALGQLAHDRTVDRLVRQALRFHTLGEKHLTGPADVAQYPLLLDQQDHPLPPEDELVEDAGLMDPDDQPG